MVKRVTVKKIETEKRIYLMYGDEFLVKQKINALIDDYLVSENKELNLTTLDGSNQDMNRLIAEIFSPSLFGGRRVILVEQTTAFMSRNDSGKLIPKALDSWKKGDQAASFRFLAKALSLCGIEKSDIADDQSSLSALFKDLDEEGKALLMRLIDAFVSENAMPEGAQSDDVIDQLLDSDLPEDVLVIISAPEIDARKKLVKKFATKGEIIECRPKQERYGGGLDRTYFDELVRDAVEKAGKKITASALNKMYSMCGTDVRALMNEVEKIVSYTGSRNQITDKDVLESFEDSHQAAFYEFGGELRSGDKVKAIAALHKNLQIVAHPLQTLAIIISELRKLILARELLFTDLKNEWHPKMQYREFQDVAKRIKSGRTDRISTAKTDLFKMKDYPLYLLLRDAQRFPMKRLSDLMEAVLETEIMMKSSKLGNKSPQILLEHLVIKFSAN